MNPGDDIIMTDCDIAMLVGMLAVSLHAYMEGCHHLFTHICLIHTLALSPAPNRRCRQIQASLQLPAAEDDPDHNSNAFD